MGAGGIAPAARRGYSQSDYSETTTKGNNDDLGTDSETSVDGELASCGQRHPRDEKNMMPFEKEYCIVHL